MATIIYYDKFTKEVQESMQRRIARQKEMLAQQISFMRKLYGISQKEFCDKIGIPPSHLSNIEAGNIESVDEICLIYDALGMIMTGVLK